MLYPDIVRYAYLLASLIIILYIFNYSRLVTLN